MLGHEIQKAESFRLELGCDGCCQESDGMEGFGDATFTLGGKTTLWGGIFKYLYV